LGKNVAVFVDVANIFYAAKAAGVDVDYVDLLKHASAGRDLVRAYAYTGLDPDNENQRNFHSFLARHGYKVVSKDIRKYGDGKVKANLDIELVVDMMKTARNLDIAIVVSGDGDFAPAIRAVQEMGVRCEVISFRGNTSSDLIEVADLFTDITRIASSDRAAVKEREAGEADLSMTVVPEKESEGSGRGRGRGRGRTTKAAEAVKAEEPRRGTRTRSRAVPKPEPAEPVDVPAAAGRGALVALPGEKLSKAAARPAPDAEIEEEEEEEEEIGAVVIESAEAESAEAGAEGAGEEAAEAGRRRRRRRGGRGRGRGHERGEAEDVEAPRTVADLEGVETIRLDDEEEEGIEEESEAPAPSRRASQSFGSIWDSQMGMGGVPRVESRPAAADEDLDEDEPEIPEYLIAERRGGRPQGGRVQGARGGRAGYSAAVDRERYGARGGGRMAEPSRSGQSQPRPQPGGQPRGGQSRGGQQRPERSERPEHGAAFSDVPPELEAMLRAQLAAKSTRPGGPAAETAAGGVERGGEAAATSGRGRGGGRRTSGGTGAPAEAASATGGRGRGRGGVKPAAAEPGGATSAPAGPTPEVATAPAARSTRGRRPAGQTAPATGAAPTVEQAAPARGRRRAKAPAGEADAAAAPGRAAATAAKPARGRKTAPAAAPADAAPTEAAEAAAKPKRAPRTRKVETAG
jgi:uncharacterized LabA/DUF88 family protein